MDARRRLERELKSLLQRVERLHDALDRVENDTYGICVDCERPIEPSRLRLVPEAETCGACREHRARATATGRRVA